jgi:hypothetical protein
MATKMSKAMYGKTMMKSGGTKKLVKKNMGGPGSGMGRMAADDAAYDSMMATPATKPMMDPSVKAKLQEIQAETNKRAEMQQGQSMSGAMNARNASMQSMSPIKTSMQSMSPIKKNGGATKTTYKEGGSAKPKCPMGMSYDFSLKKCVKPGTTDTPLDKLKKEKARMLKTNFKTGGMVNANAKLVADKSAGSKGVKVKVNPKAAASSTAKKPSKPRSKAPKKATPKAKYGMTMKKSC